MNDYAKERNNAFIEAVVNDNWNPVKNYAKKYNMQIPKAGISDELKEIAMRECIKLGFNPLIDWGV